MQSAKSLNAMADDEFIKFFSFCGKILFAIVTATTVATVTVS